MPLKPYVEPTLNGNFSLLQEVIVVTVVAFLAGMCVGILVAAVAIIVAVMLEGEKEVKK